MKKKVMKMLLKAIALIVGIAPIAVVIIEFMVSQGSHDAREVTACLDKAMNAVVWFFGAVIVGVMLYDYADEIELVEEKPSE